MIRILFHGDSITDVGRNRENDRAGNSMGCGYPLLVKARLNADHPGEYECLNRGISGYRVVDLYAQIGRSILNLKPDVLSILIGVNDVWHGLGESPNGVDAEKFERVYDWLLTEIRQTLPETRIIILEPFVLPASATVSEEEPERWKIFSREVPLRAQAAKRVAQKHGAAFVPLQEKLTALCEKADPSWWLRDGVHPTEAGHEVIAREWVKCFEKMTDGNKG